MEAGSILNYSTPEEPPGARPTHLTRLLEQEGQPCSYCIAVFLMLESEEGLGYRDKWAYAAHLAKEHHLEPYRIDP
jgi:hypothetical protein